MAEDDFIVIASGYFDPIHIGHIEYLKLAKEIADKNGGKLVVILNNDKQTELKKGKAFMPFDERKVVLGSVRYVDEVFDSIDESNFTGGDGRKHVPVSNSIEAVAKKYSGAKIIFAKGGDRSSGEIPEGEVCQKCGIDIVDGLGKKIQASSALIRGAEEK